MKTHISPVFLTLFIFQLASGTLFANRAAVSGDCDTLVAKDGTIYLVRLVRQNSKEVRYRLCDEPEGGEYTMAAKTVQEIRFFEPTSQANDAAVQDNAKNKRIVRASKDDPFVRKARFVALMGGLSPLGMYLSVLAVIAVIFAVIAITQGERLLRKAPKNHPQRDYIVRKSRFGIFMGMAAFFLPFLLYMFFAIVL